ncbi:MAG: tetratricopeptide repeat protein [Methanotrichaceae archaeon]
MVNQVNPKDGVVAYYYIGRTLSTAGRYDEAIQAYNKSIQSFNTYGEWYPGQKNICAQSWYYEGLALDSLGRTNEAQNAYNNAISLNPSITRPNRAGTSTNGGSTGVSTGGGTSTGAGTNSGAGTSSSSAQYCLLRKPFYPPQNNCYEFYLAATTASAPRATVNGAGDCDVTPLGAREGWQPDPTYPLPLSWAAGDNAMGVVSPYFGDLYGCHLGGEANNSTSTGAGNANCPSGQTNCNGLCTDTQTDSQNCGSCGNVCTEGESCVSGSCSSSGGTPQDKYAVFLLTNLEGGSVWVGSEQQLETSKVGDFPGGGGSDDKVQYVKESQDFSSYDDAVAAYCAAPKSNVRSLPLTGGTKANIYGGDYWIDTAPPCPSG